MIWMLVGCRHQDSDVAMRERLAFSEAAIRAALGEVRRVYPELEMVILSTCNRVEIYAAMEIFHSDEGPFPKNAEAGAERLLRFLAEAHGLAVEDVAPHCFTLTGRAVIEHLFRVTASLDSLVVGEAQIAGQVRDAYELAVECGTVHTLLHAAFQRAGSVAKRVAAQTALHQFRTSVPSVAVSCFAKQIFERFATKRVLVVGAGKMAEETLLYLREEGAADITVVNRNFGHARDVAAKFHGVARGWEELDDALAHADMVVSTTAAQEPIMTVERFRRVEARRKVRPLLVLDLAVPRDFEPGVGNFPNVFLYSVDDLKTVCDQNLRERKRDLPKANAIVEEKLEAFIAEIRYRKSRRVIAKLRELWDEPKNRELERLFGKLPDLSDAQKSEIAYAFDRLVNKLLHLPMESLRDEATNATVPQQRGLLEAVRRLFRLD